MDDKLIKTMGKVKQCEADLLIAVGYLLANCNNSPDVRRWASIAKTHIEQGIMALTRAAAEKPTGEIT